MKLSSITPCFCVQSMQRQHSYQIESERRFIHVTAVLLSVFWQKDPKDGMIGHGRLHP